MTYNYVRTKWTLNLTPDRFVLLSRSIRLVEFIKIHFNGKSAMVCISRPLKFTKYVVNVNNFNILYRQPDDAHIMK